MFKRLLAKIKDFIAFLSNIETVDLHKKIKHLELLHENHIINMLPVSQSAADIQTLFDKAYYQIVQCFYELIENYSNTFPVNFCIDKIAPKSKNKAKGTSNLKNNLEFQLDVAVQLRPEWFHHYRDYSVRMVIFHGHKVLDLEYSKKVSTSTGKLEFDQTVHFRTLISDLPRETTIEFLLFGTRNNSDGLEAVASTFMNLFDFERSYLQGPQFLPMTIFHSPVPVSPNEDVNSLTKCNVGLSHNLCPSTTILVVNMPKYSLPYHFPSLSHLLSKNNELTKRVPCNRSKSTSSSNSSVKDDYIYGFYGLDKGEMDKLNNHSYASDIITALQKNPLEPLTPKERDLLWNNRNDLTEYPGAILKILRCTPTCSYMDLAYVYQLIALFDEYPKSDQDRNLSHLRLPFANPIEALQLLGPDYLEIEIRFKAVNWLKNVSMDELCDYLPQLIQSLR